MERREGAQRDIPASFDILTTDGANGTTDASVSSGARGDWYRIQLGKDTMFNNAADCNVNGASKNLYTLNEFGLPGTIIHGKFSIIKLASGTLIAYKD